MNKSLLTVRFVHVITLNTFGLIFQMHSQSYSKFVVIRTNVFTTTLQYILLWIFDIAFLLEMVYRFSEKFIFLFYRLTDFSMELVE